MNDKVINQALAYLGKKSDELKSAILSKNISIDVGGPASVIGKTIAKPFEVALEKLIAEMQKQTGLIGKKNATDICVELQKLQNELRVKKMEVVVGGQEVSFGPVIEVVRELTDVIENKEQDNTEIVELLKETKSLIKNLKLVVPKVDLSGIEKGFAAMEFNLQKIFIAIRENQPEKLAEKFDAMDVVFKGLKPKDSVRFDDTQMTALMAALTNGGGGGGFTTVPGAKSATNWEVDRVALTLANTQYSYTFPSNTVSWTFKLRTPGATLFYSSVTGKLPVSGDNTTYMTMLPMGARSQDGMEWGGTTMYFETDTATQVVEIEIFTM